MTLRNIQKNHENRRKTCNIAAAVPLYYDYIYTNFTFYYITRLYNCITDVFFARVLELDHESRINSQCVIMWR